MRIEHHADDLMSVLTRSSIARYRYSVFVESLQWQLPCDVGHEQDEFDTTAATHIVVRDEDDAVEGYVRLLPTTQPYLLARHFSHLLNGAEPPSSPVVWELSRFAAKEGLGLAGASRQTEVGKRLLLEAVRFVAARGCRELIGCTTLGIERLAHRWGVDIQRLGAPHASGAGLLVAISIACNERTLVALTEGRARSRSLLASYPRGQAAAFAA
jgi:acyl homoserine lactone synthase